MTEDNFISTEARLRPIIVKCLVVEDSKITLKSHFERDLGADSLDAIDLFIAVEEEFGILIPEEDEPKLKTVENVIEYIDAALQKATADA